FTVDMPCAEGLCNARTGEDVTFTDTSSGTVARRSWNFETGGRTPSGKSVTHSWPSPGFYRSTLTVDGAGVESTASRMFRVDASSPAGSCVPGPGTVCLQDSRYEVEVEWQGGDGAFNAARVVHAGTNDSGMFSFFDRDNWEMLVKVLNGCSINGHHWVYAASATDLGYVIRVTDTATGELREFRNEAGQVASAVVDNEAFSRDCAPAASRAGWSALAGGETLSLGDGRFEVGIEWSTEDDAGVARTVRRGTEDSGLFWFFDPGNWEVLVKVLDGCGVNGHHWVYAASATSLPFEMSVTDTETGEVYRYVKGADELGALADPAAFANSCEAGR
ncbi:MAG: PKD domain-containing protein, partial [Holophagales bacterium]|nr:PKD domain-containing protein [Holophagales bacterium]